MLGDGRAGLGLIVSQALVLNRRLRAALKPPPDPGFGALRRAVRAAVVIPLAFAFTDLVLREPQSLIFVMFGCFSLLVISDFGGLRRPRALAYLITTVAGGILVCIGTLASSSTFAAVTLMFVVGVAISFTRVFGGYVAAANTGLLLSFVIAVTIPAAPSEIPHRVGGWAIAGLVSTAAAVALWPRLERVTMRRSAGRALISLADLIEGIGAATEQRSLGVLRNEAAEAVQQARHGFVDMAKRPTATARHDRAFAELLVEIDRILEMIERPFNTDRHLVRPDLRETAGLVSATASTLRSSAAVLKGGPAPDVRAVEVARDTHRAALDHWAADQLRAGRHCEEVLDGLDFEDTLRVVSYVVVLVGTNAAIAADTKLAVRDTAAHVARTVRAHLESPSTVLQSTLRVALGLALAVLVARAFDLSHAFWVVLGTIQVLRSNALGTGRTVLLAVAGNAVGVIIGGLFALVAGNHSGVMWAAFPVAVFGAAYAATTVGFMASQAAFTINLIVVFNLISPAGWQVGLVRIEDLLVGAGISLLVGVLLWPAGARRELGRALGQLYSSLVISLRGAFDRVLSTVPSVQPQATEAPVRRARDRAGAAFDVFITEHAPGSYDPETAAFLLSSASQLSLAANLLDVIAGMGYHGDRCADGARELEEQVDVLLEGYTHLAERLSLGTPMGGVAHVSLSSLRRAQLRCLRMWQAETKVGNGAMAVVMAGEWLQNLARLEDDLEAAVDTAAAAARRPWWR